MEILTQKGVLDKQASRNISFLLFGFVLARANRKRREERRREKKEKKKKEERKKKKEIKVWNFSLELLYGILGWNCLEHVWNSCLG